MSDSILLDPTTCNKRHQDPDNVYHLYNRIAHSVRFLNDEEKDDLMDRVRRIAEFCGIKLLSWCLMTNHFHLLVYLPYPQDLSRAEIERRLGLLRPEERAVFVDGFILDRAPREVTKRMYNIGMFMKIVKENFTIAYNARTEHRGTMWAGPYCFKKIPMTVEDLSRSAAYQNLNPVRACMVADYESYAWTSFAAAAQGDVVALDGIDFVFGGYETRTDVSDTSVRAPDERTDLSDTLVRPTAEELVLRMREKMDVELEEYKRERAEAVWRKRLAGVVEERADPLTSEAMVAQVEAQMAKLRADDFREELARILGRMAEEDEVKVIRAMAADPAVKTGELAKIAGASVSRVKRISQILQKLGIVRREGTRRRSVWRIALFRTAEVAA